MFMHSILPHEHHDELSSTNHDFLHESADSFLDYVKLIFHHDMGEGHLEHFDCGNNDFNVEAPVITALFNIPEITIWSSLLLPDLDSKPFLTFDDPLPDIRYQQHFSLRGPPSIS